MFKNNFRYKLIFVITLLVIFTSKVSAANLSLSPSSTTVSVGNIFSLKVVVSTGNKPINNTEAVVQFPVDMLEVVSIAKSSSIFSLWVEEPSFSNYTGKIVLNGGVPNPGFTGENGSVVSITFKAKKQGTASVIFGDAAVRENDGLGTDILVAKNSSVIQIGVPKITDVSDAPVVKNSTPSKPIVFSDTHPDQEVWYSGDTASFSWKAPSDITSIQALMNKVASFVPTTSYDSSVSQKTLNNLNDGIFYFHIRYSNSSAWGPVANYKVKVDSTAPLAFTPVIKDDGYKNIIKLNATDATSGIDYYTLKIDSGSIITVNNSELINKEYYLPINKEGNHNIVVTAYDKAKNHTEATMDFLSPKIVVPEISVNPQEIIKGENVTILGKTNYSNTKVEITLEPSGDGSSDDIKKYTQTTADDGTFSITTNEIKTVGLVKIWAEIVFSDALKSQQSKMLYLTVKDSKVVTTTLAVLYPLLGLIAIVLAGMMLIFALYFGWHKFFGLKNKIHVETQNTIKDVHKAMLLLKDELSGQLEILENIKGDRVLNKKEESIFNEIKKNLDVIDNFIEKKLKNLT